eukprot:Protomagalhaensia_wolfi_Nauph_80__1653@NODE_2021_length_1242_cov_6_193682_g1581_i0_p2_GENE_NODE_2021_length_1242_cov_6_193682_g1581_i0NODE_2021_length_1242_cov_6_193682_g1581_i0_p2_ORF_typecomplete_len155_score10_43DUF1127/PF06568_11/0_29_NODE_2021_length_1242_cov_6_193682_g1581_i0124588
MTRSWFESPWSRAPSTKCWKPRTPWPASGSVAARRWRRRRRCREALAALGRAQAAATPPPPPEPLRRVRDRKFALLSTMVDLVLEWRAVEAHYWAALDQDHQHFCAFVEKIDNVQRKFKSLGDFERRLFRKVQRAAKHHNPLEHRDSPAQGTHC